MENGYKLGKAIKDKEILSIKKINKNMTITVDGRYNSGYDRYDILSGSTIKITSVRKYKNRYYSERDNSFVMRLMLKLTLKIPNL